jgi:hypothetical protein
MIVDDHDAHSFWGVGKIWLDHDLSSYFRPLLMEGYRLKIVIFNEGVLCRAECSVSYMPGSFACLAVLCAKLK